MTTGLPPSQGEQSECCMTTAIAPELQPLSIHPKHPFQKEFPLESLFNKSNAQLRRPYQNLLT